MLWVLLLALGRVCDALAQDLDDELSVAISEVDSAAFPQVTARVAVSGEDGLPVDGLTNHSFTLLEDGLEVPAASVVVKEDTTQSFSMVLALDVSTKPESLALVQEAVKSFLDTLGPQDRVAIVAFYDEVQVVQGFTGNEKALNAALNALGPQGDHTALYQTVLECATMAGAPPAGRGAVVVFTDSAENVRNVSITAAVNQALELRVPVYTIGFGPKIDADDLQELSDLTGGRAFVLSELEEMRDKLQEIRELLRQGYKVVFQSGLQADAAGHDFSVGVGHRGQAGQAQGHFVAVPGEVLVTLPGLVEGQMVGGVVNLTALVTDTAPAATVSVTYWLDGERLAEVDAPPYIFDWDSTTVAPGAYTVAARATDSAGNEGQTGVSLTVVLPLVVTLSTRQEVVELGEPITVEAQVESLAELSGVEFSLDGEVLDNNSGSVAPFRLSLESGTYLAGAHTVTARARDILGREQEARLAVEFVAPPEPETPGWWTAVATGIVVAILIASMVALVILARLQRKRYRIVYRLEICNLGNVESRYELRADEPSGSLKCEFTLEGKSLNHRQVAPAQAGVSQVVSVENVVASPVPATQQASSARRGKQAAGRAGGVGGAFINLLATLGALLPRPVGQPLLEFARKTRQGQMQVRRAQRVSRQASQVKSAATTPTPAPPPATSSARPSVPSQVVTGRSAAPAGLTVTPDEIHAWSQTPAVEPGESLMVDLEIDPLQPHRSQYYPFAVLSRSVEQQDAPLVIEEAGVQIVRPSWFDRHYPFLVVFFVVTVTLVLFAAFLVSTGAWG
jgi:VWFA-related protein